VATERDGGGNTVVPVRVNGRADGRFIVDTGASVVTMSEDFARRAGIGDGERTTAEAMLADGRKVTASAVLLSSVQTGEARGERIAAVILPGPPAPGLDGLLGMSFLGRFVMHLDGAAGRLTLREFKPEDGM
jgi:aspartyl protease family protein